jgi:hypothetical protein
VRARLNEDPGKQIPVARASIGHVASPTDTECLECIHWQAPGGPRTPTCRTPPPTAWRGGSPSSRCRSRLAGRGSRGETRAGSRTTAAPGERAAPAIPPRAAVATVAVLCCRRRGGCSSCSEGAVGTAQHGVRRGPEALSGALILSLEPCRVLAASVLARRAQFGGIGIQRNRCRVHTPRWRSPATEGRTRLGWAHWRTHRTRTLPLPLPRGVGSGGSRHRSAGRAAAAIRGSQNTPAGTTVCACAPACHRRAGKWAGILPSLSDWPARCAMSRDSDALSGPVQTCSLH